MADYSITASAVRPSTNAQLRTGTAGVAITQGQILYKDTADSNLLKLADANGATAIVRKVEGIAVNAAHPNQPVHYVIKDPSFTPGYTLPAGEVVVLASDTPGASAPEDDAASGDYVTVLGIGIGTNKMNIPGFSLATTTIKV